MGLRILGRQSIKFQSYGGAWHKAMNVHIEKYILISGFFRQFVALIAQVRKVLFMYIYLYIYLL